MSSIFVRLGILVVLLQNLQPAFGQLNDCEAFDGPQTGLETYCQDEINKRQYKSIVRNGQRNPLSKSYRKTDFVYFYRMIRSKQF